MHFVGHVGESELLLKNLQEIVDVLLGPFHHARFDALQIYTINVYKLRDMLALKPINTELALKPIT
jgi:hypothetical protein